jgi:acetyl CoA:N6-hydroxylysine acetyl transferase
LDHASQSNDPYHQIVKLMSTKPTVLYAAPKNFDHPEDMSSGLCASLFHSGIERGVTSKELPEQHLRVSVRPFNVDTDIATLYKWMCQEYAGPLLHRTQPPSEMEELYLSMIESDISQPFMGLINDVPICQIDVYKAQQDAISLYYNARPGDYGIKMELAPLVLQQNITLLLQTCLEYFFSFPEVGRIVADIDMRNDSNQHMFKEAGFRNTGTIQGPYKSAALYICTRNSFRQAVR